jgi:hypothetical protein
VQLRICLLKRAADWMMTNKDATAIRKWLIRKQSTKLNGCRPTDCWFPEMRLQWRPHLPIHTCVVHWSACFACAIAHSVVGLFRVLLFPHVRIFVLILQAAVQTTRMYTQSCVSFGNGWSLTGPQGSPSYESSPYIATTGYGTHPIIFGPHPWTDRVDRHHIGRPFAHA